MNKLGYQFIFSKSNISKNVKSVYDLKLLHEKYATESQCSKCEIVFSWLVAFSCNELPLVTRIKLLSTSS